AIPDWPWIVFRRLPNSLFNEEEKGSCLQRKRTSKIRSTKVRTRRRTRPRKSLTKRSTLPTTSAKRSRMSGRNRDVRDTGADTLHDQVGSGGHRAPGDGHGRAGEEARTPRGCA